MYLCPKVIHDEKDMFVRSSNDMFVGFYQM